MRISLNHHYKSLGTKINLDIPSFTIITGINGSGKTHLLSGLQGGAIRLVENSVNISQKRIKYIPVAGFIPRSQAEISASNIMAAAHELWQSYDSVRHNIDRNSETSQVAFDDSVTAKIKRVAELAGKHIADLVKADFYNYYPDVLEGDLFNNLLAGLFMRYYTLRERNRYLEYRSNRGLSIGEFLTEEKFVEKFGQEPWVLFNKICKDADFDYRINTPEGDPPDLPYRIKLISNVSGAEIEFKELSSGEMVIMSIMVAVYNASFESARPRVLLLDEPDASLHPLMTKQFLNILHRVFVNEHGINIIMTTHSPSTVALADEDSLFVMNKTGRRLEKTTKDKALRVLTAGLPSFSINYENRRQVFVEGKHDVSCYEKIYEKLRTSLDDEVSLSFISSGTEGSGSCEQVKKVVSTLNGFGNRFIFGIVDWDKNNSENGQVFVLGENKRYSLENYIFDPILLVAYLLREKIIQREELGLTGNENYSDFKNLNVEKLQNMVKFLTDKLFVEIKPTEKGETKSKYLKGFELSIPLWYVYHDGHELESVIKKIFPPLSKFRGEGTLKREILDKVVDDVPELIPFDMLELFQKIQQYERGS